MKVATSKGSKNQIPQCSHCDSEGRGFEPPRLPIKSAAGKEFYIFEHSRNDKRHDKRGNKVTEN